MDVRHADRKLERLETEASFTGGFGPDVARAYRRRMQYIRSALDERDFYQMKSLHYEKLKGRRSHQRSMRLNDQLRLVIELEKQAGVRRVVIASIEDYH